MKRFIIILLIVLFLPCVAYADDQYNEYVESFDLSSFEQKLDKDTYSMLEDLGIADFDYERLSSLTIDDFISLAKKLLEGKIDTPFQSSLIILAFVILSSFFQSFRIGDSDALVSTYSTVSSLIISTVLLTKISGTVTLCASCVEVAADFVYAFVPAFSAIVASSGGVTTAFATNTMLLSLAQGLSFLSANVFIPCVNCFLALGICSSLRRELNLGRVVSTMKRIITTLISICAAGFVSILSIKTAVAAKADAIGLRSIRFAINSVVPVIGSAISEGLLSIQSYSSLIKNSVGVVGVISVALVFLPSIIEVVLWRFMLSVCSLISDAFGDNSVSHTLQAFKDCMLLINVVLILSMVTTIISIGILIAARNG